MVVDIEVVVMRGGARALLLHVNIHQTWLVAIVALGNKIVVSKVIYI